MIRKVLIMLYMVGFFAMFSQVLGQNESGKAVLVRVLNQGSGDWGEIADNIAFELVEGTKSGGKTLAIRVCSTQPLPIAISHLREYTIDYQFRLSRWGIDDKKIVYLTNSEQCTSSEMDRHIEYWLVSDDAEFPAFREMRLATNLAEQSIIRWGRKIQDSNKAGAITLGNKIESKDYIESVENLIVEAKKNNRALISIQYCKNRPDDKELESNLLLLRESINKAGISEARVYWKAFDFGHCANYPDIYLLYER